MVQRPQSDPGPNTSPSGEVTTVAVSASEIKEHPSLSHLWVASGLQAHRVVSALGGRCSHEIRLVGAPLRLASQTPFPQPSSL